MILQYGSFSHALNEAKIATSRRREANSDGVMSLERVNYQISGYLHAADQPGLTTAIQALELGYAQENVSLTLYLDDGVTPSAHSINANTALYVRATVKPSYPTSEGGEYSTYRYFEIEVEALFPVNLNSSLISFNESLQFSGGGPKYILQRCITGPANMVQTEEQVPYRCTQVGSATGIYTWPQYVAQPLFPYAILDGEKQSVEADTPQRQAFGTGLFYTVYPVRWAFFFESTSALSAVPRLWV